ncbi:MAG: hypothetical protein ABI977_24155 [Acidobacteriota bacterium]
MKRNLTMFALSVFALELLFAGSSSAQAQAVTVTAKRKPPVYPIVTVKPKNEALPNLGNFRITVPIELDLLGSGFKIANGSVLTAVTSMGAFTTRDKAIGAVIPYLGLEANLKFIAHVNQDWEPPSGVIWADLMPMRKNLSAGIREFRTNDQTLLSFDTSRGVVTIPGLDPGEYMIRGKMRNGEHVFLPLSVREDLRPLAQ